MGLRAIQILRITYLSYLGKVFETLTDKIQSFQWFKNSRRFRVFNSKRWKWREIANFGSILSYFIAVGFLKLLLIMFFVWKSLFRLVIYYFPAFPAFPAFPSNRPVLKSQWNEKSLDYIGYQKIIKEETAPLSF